MALNPTTLQNSLANLFGPNGRPRSPIDAAQQWAQAYAGYASAAMTANGGTPVGQVPALFMSPLLGAFTGRDPVTTAQAFGQALLAFWTPVAWVGPPNGGLTTVVPGALSLPATLLALMASLTMSRANVDQAAQQWAQALHAATILTVVTYILPPPAPPLIAPIT